jgi:hypothetical protein
VKDSNNLQRFSFNPEKDDVSAFRRNLASWKKIISASPYFRPGENLLKLRPKRIEVQLLLSRAPFFEGVGADGSKVRNCGWS